MSSKVNKCISGKERKQNFNGVVGKKTSSHLKLVFIQLKKKPVAEFIKPPPPLVNYRLDFQKNSV